MSIKGIISATVVLMVLISSTCFAGKKIIIPTDYKSIQIGMNECEEGDTVFVLKGTYKELVVMADNIVLMGESPSNTIIKGNQSDPVIRASNNSILTNFTIKGGSIGVLSENTNMLIQNNVITENSNTGIQCLISLPHIQNNIIVDNGWSGVFCELVAYGMRTAVEHNIIAENGYSGVTLSRKSGVLVQNNVFYQNKQYGVYVSKDSRKSRIIFNDFFKNRREYNEYAVVDATNISKDPAFPKYPWEKIEIYFALSQSQAAAQYDNPLKNLGKNGVPIGLVTREGLTKLFKDSDEDGIADDEDRCPDIVEDFDGFEDEDGCPDYDNDEDGLYDSKDSCPKEAEDFDGFQDQDGCPDPDNDNDGVADTIDKCPNRAETLNEFKDDDGCPDEKPQQEK